MNQPSDADVLVVVWIAERWCRGAESFITSLLCSNNPTKQRDDDDNKIRDQYLRMTRRKVGGRFFRVFMKLRKNGQWRERNGRLQDTLVLKEQKLLPK